MNTKSFSDLHPAKQVMVASWVVYLAVATIGLFAAMGGSHSGTVVALVGYTCMWPFGFFTWLIAQYVSEVTPQESAPHHNG